MGAVAALPAIWSSLAGAGAGAVLSRATRPHAAALPPPPQPEKAPDTNLFSRRKKTGGAYGITPPEALGSAPTASTKLGQ